MPVPPSGQVPSQFQIPGVDYNVPTPAPTANTAATAPSGSPARPGQVPSQFQIPGVDYGDSSDAGAVTDGTYHPKTLVEAAKHGAGTFVPDAKALLGELKTGLDPRNQIGPNATGMLPGLYDLGTGALEYLGSKATGQPVPDDQAMQTAENFGNSIKALGTGQGWRDLIANHPAHLAFNAATMAAPVARLADAGIDAGAAGLSTLAGKVAAKIPGAAGRLSDATDAALGTGVDASGVKGLGLDDATRAAVKADPAFKQNFHQMSVTSGANAATARAALAKTQDIDEIPTSLATGVAAADPSAAAASRAVSDQAISNFGEKAEQIGNAGGAGAPADIGAAVGRAEAEGKNAIGAKFQDAYQKPYILPPDFSAGLISKVKGAIDEGQPTKSDMINKMPENYPVTRQMVQNISRYNVSSIRTPMPLAQLQEINSALSNLANGAEGVDRDAAFRALRAFYAHGEDAVAGGKLLEQATMAPVAPDVAKAVADNMNQARTGYVDHLETYGNASKNTTGPIAAATKQLDQGYDANGVYSHLGGNMEAAGNKILDAIVDTNGNVKPGAEGLHSVLTGSGTGSLDAAGQTALNNGIRQRLLARDPATGGMKNPRAIAPFLNSRMSKVFTPTEQHQLRMTAAGHSMHAVKTLKAPKTGHGPLRSAAHYAANLGAGYIGSAIDAAHPILGFVAGRAIEGGTEKALGKMFHADPFAGAPKNTVGRIAQGAKLVGKAATLPLKAAALPTKLIPTRLGKAATALASDVPQPAPQQAEGGRVGRKTGGRVMNHAARAAALVRAAEHAKTAHKRRTRSLLRQPDEVVTKALALTNRSNNE